MGGVFTFILLVVILTQLFYPLNQDKPMSFKLDLSVNSNELLKILPWEIKKINLSKNDTQLLDSPLIRFTVTYDGGSNILGGYPEMNIIWKQISDKFLVWKETLSQFVNSLA